MATDISLKELISTGAHFGHQTRRWNPKMSQYLFGAKEGIHIFDLVKTKKMLEEALGFLKSQAKEGKIVLFVGTKKQAKDKIKEVALATNSLFINERWLGGILTNFEQIKKTTQRLTDTKKKLETGEFKNRTKKERLIIDKDIKKLERFFGGLTGITKIPDLLVIVDVKRERTAVKEAVSVEVPIIAIIDSNSDPDQIDYPIPMNDDAGKAVEYVLDLMKDAVLEGKGIKKTKIKENKKGVEKVSDVKKNKLIK